MKHKYQINLSRRLIASSFAAVFSAGAFSSYVGAMEKIYPKLLLKDAYGYQDSETNMPISGKQNVPIFVLEGSEGGVKLHVNRQILEFENIKKDQISIDFYDRYLKGDFEKLGDNDEEARQKLANETLSILRYLDKNAKEFPKFTFEDLLNTYTIVDKDSEEVVKLLKLYKKGYCADFDKDLPKLFDVYYFLAKGYLETNKSGKLNIDFDVFLLVRSGDCLEYALKDPYFKSLNEKIGQAAEKYFSGTQIPEILQKNVIKKQSSTKEGKRLSRELHYKMKRVKEFLILFLVTALFYAGNMVVYNYYNINKQEDKDSSKKEPIDKEDSTGKIQNSAGENKNSTGRTQKAAA